MRTDDLLKDIDERAISGIREGLAGGGDEQEQKRFARVERQLGEQEIKDRVWNRWVRTGIAVSAPLVFYGWVGYIAYALPQFHSWNLPEGTQIAIIGTVGLHLIVGSGNQYGVVAVGQPREGSIVEALSPSSGDVTR